MKTILVPLDFSDVTARQLDVLQTYLPANPCRVLLAHVHHSEVPLDNVTTIEADRDHAADEREMLAAHLADLKAELEPKGVSVDSVFRTGPISATLLKLIKEEAPELVVMGTHGHSRLFNLLLGSTAEALLRRSGVPVLFVPPQKDS